MGQHKVEAQYKTNVPKVRQRIHNWPEALWQRMEKIQAKFKVPVLGPKGEKIGTRTPSMDECVEFWMGSFLDMFEAALKQQERKDAWVMTPEELRQQGVKLPNDLVKV